MPDFPANEPSQGDSSPVGTAVPMDWKSAILDLISSRSAIFRLELADYRRKSARRVALLIVAVLAAASGWLLLLAGAVPLLACTFGISWPVMALIMGGVHVVGVGICLALARPDSGPAFPATLSEFQKDREWIENLTRTPKS
jgi:uncharacterized membrane protein YqjE